MRNRLATATLAIPILVFFVWMGGFLFTCLVGTLTAIAAFELGRMATAWGDRPNNLFVVTTSIIVVISTLFYGSLSHIGQAIGLISTAIAFTSTVYLLYLSSVRGLQTRLTSSLAVVGVIAGTMVHAPLLRQLDDGMEWMIILLIVGFSTDTGAYVIGRCFGHLKLAPTISPGKTWEGAIGGLVCAIIACAISVSSLQLQIPVVRSAALGATLGITGQLGDLIESRLKRQAGFKDSSLFVPGHGGVFNRLDSIVWILVVVYHFTS